MLFLICAAARQPRRGRFEDVSLIERVLGSRKRAQAFLTPRRPGKEPDVVQLEDGTYYLAGWDEWQEGDFTVSERVRRVRAKRDAGVSEPFHSPLHEPLQDGFSTVTQPDSPRPLSPTPPITHTPRARGVVRCARDGSPTGDPASGERKPATGPSAGVTPPLAAPPQGEPPPTPATPAEARARALSVLGPPRQLIAIDHDPDDELQAEIVRRCEDLARRIAARDGREPEPDEALEVLRAVSTTPGGQFLESLRFASAEWLAVTLASCDAFERDQLGQEPRGSAA
jgi:hypothetical protein